MLWKVLKNMGVNRLQMLGVEIPANGVFVKLADAILNKVGFVLLARRFLGKPLGLVVIAHGL
jgi:hypothetical protein